MSIFSDERQVKKLIDLRYNFLQHTLNKKFKSYLTIFFLFFFALLIAKDLNLPSFEKEIIKYNREGRYELSQKKLLDLLFSDLTKEEKANVLYLLAATYRGLSDYRMCLEYLNKSSAVAKDLPKDNILRMKLDYEYAFSYFDMKEYEKCSEKMKQIASQKYTHIIPENQAYIFMQEGYLFLRNKDYDNAEKKYLQALNIMKTANYCNLPIVYVKMMDFYSQKKNIKKAEKMYAESMKISKGCNILKYETYSAAQIEIIYKQNNLLDKAYAVSLKVDSLRKLENIEDRISEMHIIDKKYMEKQEILERKYLFWEKIIVSVISIVLLSLIGYSSFKGRNLKSEKIKMEEEIIHMKENLNNYAKNYNSNENFTNANTAIINPDKLTSRQKELFKLMADGLSNKEIADRLFITESTVKYHIKNIYSILELKDRKDFFKKLNQN